MNGSTTLQMTRTSPCHCGGPGAVSVSSCTCTCTCGSSDCSTCQNEGYTRPRFFAGQLLTEDDLQQLTDYIVAKNRLHTRYLTGSGVVCGLEVTCHPCGGGMVLVSPGYALDCCGNDIVLSCPQPLDINKMVNDLRLKLRGGFDCGDPCAAVEAPGPAQHGATYPQTKNQDIKGGTTKKLLARKYCLYINYCEQPSDPVSPYVTDSPCGPSVCEPTRIREGFRFELRCPEAEKPEAEICTRYWNCVGDLTALEGALEDSGHLRRYGKNILAALAKIRDTPGLTIDDPQAYLKRLRTATTNLRQKIELLGKFKASQEIKDESDRTAFRSVFDAIASLSSDVALLRIQSSDEQFRLGEREVQRAEAEAGAAEASAKGSQIISDAEKTLIDADHDYHELGEIVSQGIRTALERAYVSAVFDLVQRLKPTVAERPSQITDTDVRFLAAGAVFTSRFEAAAADSLTAIREWLLRRLEQLQQSTHCELLQKISSVTLPPANAQAEVTLGEANLIGVASQVLGKAAKELQRICFCSVLIPPCPSCDDLGVLLACLTVEDCQVKDICNFERDVVISPIAIRYWIPEIQKVGEAIEKWCCAFDQCHKSDLETEGNEQVFTGMALAPGYAPLAHLLFETACPEPGKPSGLLGSYFFDAISRIIPPPPAIAAIRPAPVTWTEDVPKAEAVSESVKKATADLEEKLGNALMDLESVNRDYKNLLDRVSSLESRLDKRQKTKAEG